MNLNAFAGGVHRFALRPYFEDTDAGGVVYHARYLHFAERGRTEALRDLGVSHAEMVSQHGVMFMVRRIKVDYLHPASLDESLLVLTRTLAVGAATARLRQDVVREEGGRELARLDVELACVRLADGRAARMPSRWRLALAGLVDGLENAPNGAQ
jgi:acyl-CoA thioester hydrolase